jgi:2'-5' RNA ligase
MRLFAAVPLPAEAYEVAAARLRALRELGWPVRWVREEGLHLTLKFFGEVTTDRLDTIVEMLEFCAQGLKPITLAVTGAGVFPHARVPRVIRLDVSPAPELELLQDRIERGGEGIGFPPEGRPFHPHITLGRVREGHRLPPGALEELMRPVARAPFVADRMVLFESRLGPRGPHYLERAVWLFG